MPVFMPVFEVDGLPYIDAAWLERRIYRDFSRMQRWRQGRTASRSGADAAGRETMQNLSHASAAHALPCREMRRCPHTDLKLRSSGSEGNPWQLR